MVWSRGSALLVVLGGVFFGCETSHGDSGDDDGSDMGGGAGGDTGGRASGGTSAGIGGGGNTGGSGGATTGGVGGSDTGGRAGGGGTEAGRGGAGGDSAGAGSSAGGASGASGTSGSAGMSAGRGGAAGVGGMTAGNGGAGALAGAGAGGAGGAMAGGGGSLGSGAAPNGQSCARGGLCASGHCVRGVCVAPPNWGPVQVLGTRTGSPSIAMPEFGRAAVAWRYDLDDEAYANVATAKTFGSAQRIDTQTGSSYNSEPDVAYAGNQRYLVTWSETNASDNYDVWARVHDGSWGSPIDVDGGTEDMGAPKLATNLAGNGALIWLDRTAGTILAKLVAGTTLGSVVGDFSYAHGHSVGVSPSGRVAVAWCLTVTGTSDLWARTYAPGVGWTAPQEAWRGTLQRSCDLTRVAINDAGEVMVTWESRIAAQRVPMGSFRTAAGVWEHDLLADTPGLNSASFPRAVFSASGALMVSWIWFDSTRPANRSFLHYRVRSGGRWTPVLEVDACSYDDMGNALATYDYESFRMIYPRDIPNTLGLSIYEARYVGGQGIVERRMIAPPAPVAFGYQIALDADGRGLFAWVYQEDTFPSAPAELRAMWLE